MKWKRPTGWLLAILMTVVACGTGAAAKKREEAKNWTVNPAGLIWKQEVLP